jgi:hypothetical protein
MNNKIKILLLLAVAALIITPEATAFPGEIRACNGVGCHTQSAAISVSAVPATLTVSPGQSFIVDVTWSGGSATRQTIAKWPTDFTNIVITRNNTLFSPVPVNSPIAINPSGTLSSTLTAPNTAGIHTIRVYASSATPLITNFADIAVTVSTPAVVNGNITGKVTNASNASQPIVGATVTAGVATATTDAQGNYIIPNIAPATYGMTASAAGFVTNTITGVIVTAGGTTTRDFALVPVTVAPPANGNATGTVFNASSGAPIAGATLTSGPLTVTTNANGIYTISDIAPGPYNVTASAANYSSNRTLVTVLAGETVIQDFALVPLVGVKGDLNTIPGLDVGDVLFCAQFVAGVRTPTTAQLALADVNTITGMDVGDVLFVAQAVAGLRQLV